MLNNCKLIVNFVKQAFSHHFDHPKLLKVSR
jgi:hypothetical protein